MQELRCENYTINAEILSTAGIRHSKQLHILNRLSYSSFFRFPEENLYL